MGKNVLIGVTGSVAALKLPLLVRSLKAHSPDINIRIVVTSHSIHFFNPNDLKDHPASSVSSPVEILRDEDEWSTWKKISDDVLHIELRKWADVFIIAPLDANTMAKMAVGICDNLLTCVVRAWDLSKPLYFAPAMNTHMWNHPLTKQHLSILSSFGYKEIPPVVKKLACGDFGSGGMADVDDIVVNVLGDKE